MSRGPWDISAEEYLNKRMHREESCWIWIKCKDKDGYGQCQDSYWSKQLRVTRAHQLSYVISYGDIPKGKIILHTCDNPSCCNPDHLYAGTWKDNSQDCLNRGRHKNGAHLLRKVDYSVIVSEHGKLTCEEVAAKYGISFSGVCRIWRLNGKYGRKSQAERQVTSAVCSN